MSLIDDIKRDRGAGTPGPWVIGKALDVSDYGFEHLFINSGEKVVLGGCGCCGSPNGHCGADPRRIARVPDMEAALLAADRLADAVEAAFVVLPANSAVSDVISALAAYREAVK